MKALIIASLLFFALRAMSSEIGENLNSECPYAVQTAKREVKNIAIVTLEDETKKESNNISK